MPKKLAIFLSALMISATGCATYHEKPLTPVAVDDTLAAPDMAALRVAAEQIRHPILRPVEIEPSQGLTPDQAAVLAVLINPRLGAERDKRHVAAAQLYQAGILPNPQFTGGLDFPVAGTTQGTVSAYGLSLDYDIYALFTRGAEVQAGRLHGQSVDLDVAWQEWQVAEAAKQHAYRLYLLQKQLDLARKEEKGLQENRDAVKHAVDRGNMTIIDLSAAQASLEKVHLSVLAIEQNLAQERFALLDAIGFEPNRSIQLRQAIALPEVSAVPPLNVLMDGIADRRLDLVALRIGYQSQEQRVRAAVLGQFPRITTGVSQARDTGNVVTRGFSITIGLPFFDRNQGQIAIERATRQQLFDEYVARFYDARATIARLRADIESIARQIEATRTYIPAEEKLVETYHRALLQGNADVLTYYNARDSLVATRISILDLQMQLVDQFIALEIASGEYLWVERSKETQQ
jgi:outer membrane protein, heavy metal efflux system